jgi:DNA (cytosine-5)-methyltransferase 1
VSVDTSSETDIDLAFLQADQPSATEETGEPLGIVDLFSGCGGMTIGAIEGARRAERQAVLQLAVDVWPAALEVIELTLDAADRTFELDIANAVAAFAEPERLSERPLVEAGQGAALLLAGPPCQGHSALNNHTRHDDPRNDLYLAVARVARLLRPRAVIIENVRGVKRDRRGAVERCTAALEELGYHVGGRTLNLHELGAAQRRIRHVLVATLEQAFDFDALITGEGRDVRWAIEDLADVDGATLMDTASVATAENQRRMDWLFEHDQNDLPNPERPKCHQDDHSYRSMYGRLRWNEPAQTITSGFGCMGQGRFVHPLDARTLTPHEAARLQFLPDFMDFSLVERRTELATMIGNAAPPIMTIALVQTLIHQQLL